MINAVGIGAIKAVAMGSGNTLMLVHSFAERVRNKALSGACGTAPKTPPEGET
jgi:hypothetical protein